MMIPYTLQRPKAVLFDWDGTLANTIPLMQASINHILGLLGRPPITFGVAALSSVAGSAGVFKHVLGDELGVKAKAMYEEYLDEVYAKAGGPVNPDLAIDGAGAALQHLKDMNIPVGIATNKMWGRFQMERDALGFGHYIATAVTLDQVTNRKPHPEMIELAIQRLGLTPGPDVWMVGDHRVDVESAKQAGASAVFLDRGFDVSDTHPPDAIVPDLHAFIKLVEECRANAL